MVTRIRQLLDTKQLTPTQFADFIGVGRPVISHILSERNKPSLEVVQRIISAFPEISLPWLLSGVGDMLGEVTLIAPTNAPAAEFQQAAAPIEEEEAAVATETTEPEALQPSLPFISIPEEPVEAAPVIPAATAAPVPAVPVSVATQAFTATAAPRAFVASTQPLPAAPAPLVSTPVAPVLPPTAAVMQPFRAAKFVPAARVPATTVRKPAVANLPALENSAPSPTSGLGSVLPPLASDKQAASLSTVPTTNKPGPEAMLPFLGEPGKEIRRIVIFYRDGSFADYQPEA